MELRIDHYSPRSTDGPWNVDSLECRRKPEVKGNYTLMIEKIIASKRFRCLFILADKLRARTRVRERNLFAQGEWSLGALSPHAPGAEYGIARGRGRGDVSCVLRG